LGPGKGVANLKKEADLIRPVKSFLAARPEDAARNLPLPPPEEGLRLMHAFLTIKHADVREAIIVFVEEQSKAHSGL
jgi:hypothetical protein